jgi:hypothetical protein
MRKALADVGAALADLVVDPKRPRRRRWSQAEVEALRAADLASASRWARASRKGASVADDGERRTGWEVVFA